MVADPARGQGRQTWEMLKSNKKSVQVRNFSTVTALEKKSTPPLNTERICYGCSVLFLSRRYPYLPRELRGLTNPDARSTTSIMVASFWERWNYTLR